MNDHVIVAALSYVVAWVLYRVGDVAFWFLELADEWESWADWWFAVYDEVILAAAEIEAWADEWGAV